MKATIASVALALCATIQAARADEAAAYSALQATGQDSMSISAQYGADDIWRGEESSWCTTLSEANTDSWDATDQNHYWGALNVALTALNNANDDLSAANSAIISGGNYFNAAWRAYNAHDWDFCVVCCSDAVLEWYGADGAGGAEASLSGAQSKLQNCDDSLSAAQLIYNRYNPPPM